MFLPVKFACNLFSYWPVSETATKLYWISTLLTKSFCLFYMHLKVSIIKISRCFSVLDMHTYEAKLMPKFPFSNWADLEGCTFATY